MNMLLGIRVGGMPLSAESELATECVSGTRVDRAVISSELFTIPIVDGRYIVYAPLRRSAFVCNGALVDLIARIKKTGIVDSNSDPDGRIIELLRNLELADAGPEPKPITEFQGEPTPTSLTLFLSTACNLRCTYCYASAGDVPARFMDIEVAQRGVDFVIANAQRKGAKEIEITYHGGGEPTVHWKVMTESLAYAQQAASSCDLAVKAYAATNGVMSDAQIDWIIGNLNGLSVSFDGVPSVHDSNRLTVLGQGSSGQVERTLRRLDMAAFPYGIRITVTADQVSHLKESVSYICSNFNPQRIQVEPAFRLGRWNDAPSSETIEFIEAFRAGNSAAQGYGRSLFYSAARVGSLTSHFCEASKDPFALSPDGNVSACYEVFSEDDPLAETFFYGHSCGASFEFDLNVLNRLRHQAVQYRDHCSGCFAKWSCAGDCFHKVLAAYGQGELAGSARCHITRELTKDQILEKIASSGGIFWHEGGLQRSVC